MIRDRRTTRWSPQGLACIALAISCAMCLTCGLLDGGGDRLVRISGTIRDKASGRGADSALVTLRDTIDVAPFVTDSSGRFTLHELPFQAETLYVRRRGCVTAHQPIADARSDIDDILVPIECP